MPGNKLLSKTGSILTIIFPLGALVGRIFIKYSTELKCKQAWPAIIEVSHYRSSPQYNWNEQNSVFIITTTCYAFPC